MKLDKRSNPIHIVWHIVESDVWEVTRTLLVNKARDIMHDKLFFRVIDETSGKVSTIRNQNET